jgi:hypothetical protein
MATLLMLIVDNREKALAAEVSRRLADRDPTHPGVAVRVVVRVLSAGDVEIRKSKEDGSDSDSGGGALLAVFERKTWSDLASSICDGRWAEQKARLRIGGGGGGGSNDQDLAGDGDRDEHEHEHEHEHEQERVVAYIIEGGERAWGDASAAATARATASAYAYAFVDDDETETPSLEGASVPPADSAPSMPSMPSVPSMLPRVRGAMLSMLIGRSRIPVVRTTSVADTADFLLKAAAFLSDPGRQPRSLESVESQHSYVAVACRSATAAFSRKRDNVDARLCFLQQMCQIPGVSFAIASLIADAYGATSMRDLVRSLEASSVASASPANPASPASPASPADFAVVVRALQKVPKVGRKTAERVAIFLGFPSAAADAAR